MIAPQDLRDRRRHPRGRDLCRPLRLRRQGRDLRRRSPFEIDARRPTNGRSRCSASAGCAICAPRNPASPAPMRARWSTNGSRSTARSDAVAWRPRRGRAAHHLLAQPGAAGARGCRRAVLSPLPAQPDAAGAPSAPDACRDARDGVPRLQAADRAHLRGAVHGAASQRYIRARHASGCREELERQILPDGGHISRNPGALIELLVDLLPLRQAFTARNIAPPPRAAQRHRPHDADAALLPARRRQLRAVQRHGPDADRRCSPPSWPMTTPAARRSRTRRHSGYQRLESAGGPLVLMDTGRAAADAR